MATTIQISEELHGELVKRKLSERETYEDLIWNLLEDKMVLSNETKREISEARQEIKDGKYHRWEDIKKELKLNV